MESPREPDAGMSGVPATGPATGGPGAPTAEHRAAIEAIVMVSDVPADPQLLAQLVELSPEQVDELCRGLAAEFDQQGRGFELVRVAGGWRFQSRSSLSPYVERFVLTGQSARLSAAALETLSIVAYKQPISRAQVAAIRGVNVDGVMRTLQQRGYIGEISKDPGPGNASLFGTTPLFLERLGLDSLAELPPLGDFVPEAAVVEALEAGLRVEHDEEAGGAVVAGAAPEVEVDRSTVPEVDLADAPAADTPPADQDVIDLRERTGGAVEASPTEASTIGYERVESLDALEVLSEEAAP